MLTDEYLNEVDRVHPAARPLLREHARFKAALQKIDKEPCHAYAPRTARMALEAGQGCECGNDAVHFLGDGMPICQDCYEVADLERADTEREKSE